MLHSRRPAKHGVAARLRRRACASSADLWTTPAASATLPVYEDLTLQWDPSCVDITSDTVDLFLSVEHAAASEWQAVHEWTSVPYSAGQLATQLKPTWWNASSGAGSVQAQFSLVPSGQPSWNTPAPAGPTFTIAYNGSYPSVNQPTGTFNASGPSVESVGDNHKQSGLSGGSIAAAVAVPIAVVLLAVAAYVAWNRSRKRPERKRFSAVVDHRMSMISQGTWHPSHRPSGSQYTAGNRQSYFADPAANRQSTYSIAGSAVGVPSPLRNGAIRPPPPAEMRQTGQGERTSRISFAVQEGAGRPSGGEHRRGGSVQTFGSMYSRDPPRHSAHLSVSHGYGQQSQSTSPQYSPEKKLPRSGSSPASISELAYRDASSGSLAHSGSQEELGLPREGDLGSGNASLRKIGPRHGPQPSFSSSLRNELSHSAPASTGSEHPSVRAPAHAHTASQVSVHSATQSASRLRPMLLSLDTNSTQTSATSSSMPRAFRSSQILSPDEALASYARVTSPVGPNPAPGSGPASFGASGTELTRVPTDSQVRGAAKGGLAGLLGKSKGMLRSWTGGSIASALQNRRGEAGAGSEQGGGRRADEDEKHGAREGAKSPFEDPDEVVDGEDSFDEKDAEGPASGTGHAL
ncbi:hypothetical protein JCM8202v2_002664 [Rhodotorula sphaerocarpa]